MKLISWNVNGLRAVINKGFYDFFTAANADVFALQETKLQAGQLDLAIPPEYTQIWSYAQKKGYSGTAVFCKEKPLQTIHTLEANGVEITNTEGRLCAVEFATYWFICVYTPNAQDGLARMEERLAWGEAFTSFVAKLAAEKSVVICGDLNVAHQEIDLKNHKTNHGNPGFSDEERADFQVLLDAGFTDSFRYLYPEIGRAHV